jgi:ABC-type Mn2+/Zn2+ transport system permease subunit
VAIGIFSAAVGYYLSWTLSLPTGSVMVAVAASFWAAAGIKRLVERSA